MEENLSIFAKIITNDDFNEFCAFIQKNTLSATDELILIQSQKTDWLGFYINNNNIDISNLCEFVKTKLPAEHIFYKLKPLGSLSPELQQAIIESKNEQLWDLAIDKYSFTDPVLIPQMKQNNITFLRKYISKRFIQLDGQKALIRSGITELIDLYIQVHGFFREAQREFLYYLY